MTKWEIWFLLNLIVIFIGMSIAMIDSNGTLASTTLIIGMISFMPCLYIGGKS